MESNQTPNLDVKTLEYVKTLIDEEFDRLTRTMNQMMECGAEEEAEKYLAKRRTALDLSRKVWKLLKQQEA